MLDKLAYLFTKERLAQPPSLILFVTNRCNARCLHCFNWAELDKNDSTELSLAEIEKLSHSLGRLLELSISGGEPFLRPDLPEILELFSRNNSLRSFSVPTNGLLPEVILNETKRILLKARTVKITVNLSLDGLEKEHDSLRQREGAFRQLMKTYEQLRQLKEQYTFGLKVLTTLSNQNIGQLDSLMTWVKKNMPAIDFHNFEILRGNPRESSILPPTVSQLEEVKDKIFDYWRSFHFYGRSISSVPAYWLKRYLFEIYLQILKEKRQVIPCFAGTFSLVVDASGYVYFCELLPALGNIREKSLSQILSSPESRKQRASINKGSCYCVHSCFQGKNLYLNYKLYGPFLGYLIKSILL